MCNPDPYRIHFMVSWIGFESGQMIMIRPDMEPQHWVKQKNNVQNIEFRYPGIPPRDFFFISYDIFFKCQRYRDIF